MAKKGTIRKDSSKAKKGENDKLITKGKSKTPKKAKGGKNYVPNGIGRGGYRAGAGRKPDEQKEEVKALREAVLGFLNEEGEMIVTDAQGQRVVKAINNLILVKTLFHEAVKNKNVAAIKEIWDRAYGKAKQTVEMDGRLVVEDQYVPEEDLALQAALEAYHKTALKVKTHGS